MDYLRTLGSAAVSTLVQKSGLHLPFTLGTKLPQVEACYNLYDGTKRDDGSLVSIFEYDLTKKNTKPFAQNALRKLRSTRHPDVLKFMDATESDSTIYIMTERVRPLSAVLPQYSNKTTQVQEDWLLWGLQRISVALAFINEQCVSTHGNVRVHSIFISPSGEWKLGGFELLSNPRDNDAILYTLGGLLPGSSAIACPEVKKSGWSSLKEVDVSAADAYALGLLLHAVFNPSHPPPPTAELPHPPPAQSSRGSIPNPVFGPFKKLLNPNPKARFNSKGFLEVGMMEGGFFSSNRLLRVCSGLDNFALASEVDKATLLKTLKDSASSFPPEFASYKVLPSLLSALEFGGATAATILPLVLLFGENVSPDEYSKLILCPIIKLYGSPDRGTRVVLLEHLPEYVEKLDKKAVSEKIFPHFQLGFADTVPLIREVTVKSVILLAPKFTERILNNDLLRLLAKAQTDLEPSIRTNTCILLGRLAPSLGNNTKRKVLIPAFSRALKDPFVHARVAGLMAFMATVDCFDVPDLASKVIPSMAFSLVDEEKLVRDQAFKALEIFTKKVHTYATDMPETAPNKDGELGLGSTGPVPAALVSSAAGAAGSLAGWAISSISKKITASDMQAPILGSQMDGSKITQDSSSVTTQNHIGEITRPTFNAGTQSSAVISISNGVKGKGMQLGGKSHAITAHVSLADQLAEEAASATLEGNPWGTDDLIDVNADEDDWGGFETGLTTGPSALANVSTSPTRTVSLDQYPSHSSTPVTIRNMQPIPRSPAVPLLHSQDSSWNTTDDWGPSLPQAKIPPSRTPNSSLTMTKVDKAAEMARRKEERKQRIALLKEQKKAAAKT